MSPHDLAVFTPTGEAPASAEPAARGAAGPSPLFKRPGMVQLHAPSPELQDLKDRYMAWMFATRYSLLTVKSVHVCIESLYKYLGPRGVTRIADVTGEVLRDYSLWLRAQPNARDPRKTMGTRNFIYRLTGLKWYFDWLTRNMIVLVNPAEQMDIPKLKPALPQTILSQVEVKRLLHHGPDLTNPVGYRDRALLELIYATGVRSAELFKIKLADLDLKARTVFIHEGKGGKDRILPLPGMAAAYLKEYIQKVRPRFATRVGRPDDGTLFLGWLGARVDKGSLSKIFERLRRTAGIEKHVTPMVLRHSIASHLLENGMDVRMIQEVLGHERLRTTTIYARVTLKGLRKQFNRHHPKEKRARHQMIDEVEGTRA